MAKGPDGKLASNSELKKRTGFGKSKLMRITSATSFKNITVGEVDAYMSACGQHWASQRRLLWLLRRAWLNGGIQIMRHLQTDTGWQASMVRRHQRRIEQLLSKTQ